MRPLCIVSDHIAGNVGGLTPTARFGRSTGRYRTSRFAARRKAGPGPGLHPPMPCDSGIPDYRGPNGLWLRDPEAEKLVTYEHYMGDAEIRRRARQMRRESQASQAEPNAAHRAVAELEKSGTPVRVITQNVDGCTSSPECPHARSSNCTGPRGASCAPDVMRAGPWRAPSPRSTPRRPARHRQRRADAVVRSPSAPPCRSCWADHARTAVKCSDLKHCSRDCSRAAR